MLPEHYLTSVFYLYLKPNYSHLLILQAINKGVWFTSMHFNFLIKLHWFLIWRINWNSTWPHHTPKPPWHAPSKLILIHSLYSCLSTIILKPIFSQTYMYSTALLDCRCWAMVSYTSQNEHWIFFTKLHFWPLKF
jgi:hypothetical protein